MGLEIVHPDGRNGIAGSVRTFCLWSARNRKIKEIAHRHLNLTICVTVASGLRAHVPSEARDSCNRNGKSLRCERPQTLQIKMSRRRFTSCSIDAIGTFYPLWMSLPFDQIKVDKTSFQTPNEKPWSKQSSMSKNSNDYPPAPSFLRGHDAPKRWGLPVVAVGLLNDFKLWDYITCYAILVPSFEYNICVHTFSWVLKVLHGDRLPHSNIIYNTRLRSLVS